MIFLDGDTKLIKQCMPEGAEIDVETININDEEETRLAFRAKRFLFPKVDIRDFKIHYGEALLRLQEVKFHTR